MQALFQFLVVTGQWEQRFDAPRKGVPQRFALDNRGREKHAQQLLADPIQPDQRQQQQPHSRANTYDQPVEKSSSRQAGHAQVRAGSLALERKDEEGGQAAAGSHRKGSQSNRRPSRGAT